VPILLAVFCLLIATGCDEKSPTGPTVPLNERFTLAPGERATIENAGLLVEFRGVTGDSRCPADAICVWAGDAVVQVRASDSSSADYDLHTADLSRAALHRQLRIALVELQPYPFSNRTIGPGDYRATLTVTRP